MNTKPHSLQPLWLGIKEVHRLQEKNKNSDHLLLEPQFSFNEQSVCLLLLLGYQRVALFVLMNESVPLNTPKEEL